MLNLRTLLLSVACLGSAAVRVPPGVPRRAAIAGGLAAVGSTGFSLPVSAKKPLLAELVAQIDADTPERNTNGDPAKHTPRIRIDPSVTKIGVKGISSLVEFAVPHVMEGYPEPHFIELMWLKDATSGQIIASKKLRPGDAAPPIIAAYVPRGTECIPLLRCNLHGLWEGKPFKVTW